MDLAVSDIDGFINRVSFEVYALVNDGGDLE